MKQAAVLFLSSLLTVPAVAQQTRELIPIPLSNTGCILKMPSDPGAFFSVKTDSASACAGGVLYSALLQKDNFNFQVWCLDRGMDGVHNKMTDQQDLEKVMRFFCGEKKLTLVEDSLVRNLWHPHPIASGINAQAKDEKNNPVYMRGWTDTRYHCVLMIQGEYPDAKVREAFLSGFRFPEDEELPEFRKVKIAGAGAMYWPQSFTRFDGDKHPVRDYVKMYRMEDEYLPPMGTEVYSAQVGEKGYKFIAEIGRLDLTSLGTESQSENWGTQEKSEWLKTLLDAMKGFYPVEMEDPYIVTAPAGDQPDAVSVFNVWSSTHSEAVFAKAIVNDNWYAILFVVADHRYVSPQRYVVETFLDGMVLPTGGK